MESDITAWGINEFIREWAMVMVVVRFRCCGSCIVLWSRHGYWCEMWFVSDEGRGKKRACKKSHPKSLHWPPSQHTNSLADGSSCATSLAVMRTSCNAASRGWSDHTVREGRCGLFFIADASMRRFGGIWSYQRFLVLTFETSILLCYLHMKIWSETHELSVGAWSPGERSQIRGLCVAQKTAISLRLEQVKSPSRATLCHIRTLRTIYPSNNLVYDNKSLRLSKEYKQL